MNGKIDHFIIRLQFSYGCADSFLWKSFRFSNRRRICFDYFIAIIDDTFIVLITVIRRRTKTPVSSMVFVLLFFFTTPLNTHPFKIWKKKIKQPYKTSRHLTYVKTDIHVYCKGVNKLLNNREVGTYNLYTRLILIMSNCHRKKIPKKNIIPTVYIYYRKYLTNFAECQNFKYILRHNWLIDYCPECKNTYQSRVMWFIKKFRFFRKNEIHALFIKVPSSFT